MIYTADITTAANTTIANAKTTRLSVTRGLVYRIEVEFPTGPCGLLYVAIFDGAYQVWPSSPAIWWHSDGRTMAFDDLYLKDIGPFEFVIKTYNLDDTYEHWTQIRIAQVSKEAYMARFVPSLAWKEYAELLARIESEQAARREELIVSPFPWIGARKEA